MKTTFISTATLYNAPRLNLARMQAELAQASKEVVTGRHADLGLALGDRVGQSVTLRQQSSALQGFIDSNGQIAARLELSQAALDVVGKTADDFLQTMVQARGTTNDGAFLRDQALGALSAFTDAMNRTSGSRYLFAGANSAEKPLAAFDDGPRAAIEAAFAAKFTFPVSSPLAAGISPAAMQDFLENDFAALFQDPAWGTDWSNGSDATLSNRISPDDTVETSAGIHEPAFRKLAMAFAMIGGMGLPALSAETRTIIIDKAVGVIGDGAGELTAARARLGTSQDRITAATERMEREQDVITTRLDGFEGVDPAEAKVRIDGLSTQIEMSYSLTVKLLRLSIMNYA